MIKLSFPLMGDYDTPAYFLLSHIFNVDIIKPLKMTSKTIEIGSKYSPEAVCTPFKHTLGSMIESVEKGANVLIQYGGGCRYGYYGEVQNEILKKLGYNVEVINLIIKGKIELKRIIKELKKVKLKPNILKTIYYLPLTFKMIKYMDIIDNYIRENVGFEIEKNSFINLKKQMLYDFKHAKGYINLYYKYRKYLRKFHKIKTNKPNNLLKVGIIGELYTIMEPSANYYLEKNLAKNNIQIKRFTNVYYLLKQKHKKKKKYLKYVSEYVKYPLGADALDNVARTKYLCENGYDGIIHIKSAYCTPEITVGPIVSKIASEYNIPIIFMTFEANTSEVGVKTRLEAFYDMLEMRKNK